MLASVPRGNREGGNDRRGGQVSRTPAIRSGDWAAPAAVPVTKVAGLLVLVNPPAKVRPLGVQLEGNVDPGPCVYLQLTCVPIARALPAAGLHRIEDGTAVTTQMARARRLSRR